MFNFYFFCSWNLLISAAVWCRSLETCLQQFLLKLFKIANMGLDYFVSDKRKFLPLHKSPFNCLLHPPTKSCQAIKLLVFTTSLLVTSFKSNYNAKTSYDWNFYYYFYNFKEGTVVYLSQNLKVPSLNICKDCLYRNRSRWEQLHQI